MGKLRWFSLSNPGRRCPAPPRLLPRFDSPSQGPSFFHQRSSFAPRSAQPTISIRPSWFRSAMMTVTAFGQFSLSRCCGHPPVASPLFSNHASRPSSPSQLQRCPDRRPHQGPLQRPRTPAQTSRHNVLLPLAANAWRTDILVPGDLMRFGRMIPDTGGNPERHRRIRISVSIHVDRMSMSRRQCRVIDCCFLPRCGSRLAGIRIPHDVIAGPRRSEKIRLSVTIEIRHDDGASFAHHSFNLTTNPSLARLPGLPTFSNQSNRLPNRQLEAAASRSPSIQIGERHVIRARHFTGCTHSIKLPRFRHSVMPGFSNQRISHFRLSTITTSGRPSAFTSPIACRSSRTG